MMDEQTKQYLISLLPDSSGWAAELEEEAAKDHVPIMDPLGIRLLMQLVRLKRPERILEVGTAIGYSALQMLAAYPEASIVTIERDEVRYKQAAEHIERQQQSARIETIFGDALDEMASLAAKGEKFDFVFIDAAKGQYMRFFEMAHEMLRPGGLIVTDNVLFRGFVAGSGEIPKRFQKMVEKVRNYNRMLMEHPEYETTIIPIGDGVAVSLKQSGH